MQKKSEHQHLNGKQEITVEDIRKAIPKELFVKSEIRFLLSVAQSLCLTLATYYLAEKYIPLSIQAIPIWIAYAFICGTIATGLWVLGHECGH